MIQTAYPEANSYDEIFGPDGRPRPQAARFVRRIESLDEGELQRRQKSAELNLHDMGITFAVYGHEAGTEKVWPFDLVPRIIDASEWAMIERGLIQRIRALNLFIGDVYNEQKILKDNVVPRSLIYSAKTLCPACEGQQPPQGV